MSRQRFEELLDPWLMGELGVEEVAEFEQILLSDSDLAEEAREHGELARLFAQARVPAAPEGLLAGALEAAREAEVIEIPPRRRTVLRWAIGTAAAAVIVFGAYMTWDIETAPSTRKDSGITTPEELIERASAESRRAQAAARSREDAELEATQQPETLAGAAISRAPQAIESSPEGAMLSAEESESTMMVGAAASDASLDFDDGGLADNIVPEGKEEPLRMEVAEAPAVSLRGTLYQPGSRPARQTTAEMLADAAGATGARVLAMPGGEVDPLAIESMADLPGQWSMKAAPASPAPPPGALALSFPNESALEEFWFRAESQLAAPPATTSEPKLAGVRELDLRAGRVDEALRMPDELRDFGLLTEEKGDKTVARAVGSPEPPPPPTGELGLAPPYEITDYEIDLRREDGRILVTIRPKFLESPPADD